MLPHRDAKISATIPHTIMPQIGRLRRRITHECSNAGVFGQAASVLVFAACDEESPMSVTPCDIEKVALLARLAIAETDLPDVTERFSRVLSLVSELETINTNGVMPMSNPHDMEQRLRKDSVAQASDRKALMASAPAQQDGYFLVPKVID